MQNTCGPTVAPVAAARQTNARARRGRPWLWVLLGCAVASSLGCEHLFMSGGPSARSLQALIDRNRRNLLRLQPDLFEEHVVDIMGPPQRVEGYSWGTVWLYRTAYTTTVRTTPETDYTPLVFDRRRILLGWGRDFLAAHLDRGP